jgi:PKHD-type hydroxylase
MARLTKPKIELNLPERPDPTRGGGAWPLVLDHVENWAWRNGLFTPEELDTIISIGESIELVKASTYGEQSDKNRNSFVTFLFPNETTNWIFARLAGAINEMNQQFFQFDLTGMEQGLQFTKYTAPGEHYDWHVDKGHMTPSRKLSLSVQLSDPKDYKGGEFEMMFGRKPQKIGRERGMTVFFPSYTLHRVRPVTKGTRYSLVAWISGPPFK